MEPEVQIRENYQRIRERIDNAAVQCAGSGDITLLAVTKRAAERVMRHDCGITQLGENACRNYLSRRMPTTPRACPVHRAAANNKVKYIVDSVSMIQSVTVCAWRRKSAPGTARRQAAGGTPGGNIGESPRAGSRGAGSVYQAAALRIARLWLMTSPPDDRKIFMPNAATYIPFRQKHR